MQALPSLRRFYTDDAGYALAKQVDTDLIKLGRTFNGGAGARYAGALGNSLRISVCPSAQAYSANLTVTDSLRSNAVSSGDTVINVNGNANAAANIVAGDFQQQL